MANSQARQVRQFVQTLDREDRYIVLLYYADGLTTMEISRVLDLPSSRVHSRLQELRTQLSGLTLTTAAPQAHGNRGLGDAPAAYA